jgi:hypothetical protein
VEIKKYAIFARRFLPLSRTIWVCYAPSASVPYDNINERHRAAVMDFTIPADPKIFSISDDSLNSIIESKINKETYTANNQEHSFGDQQYLISSLSETKP